MKLTHSDTDTVSHHPDRARLGFAQPLEGQAIAFGWLVYNKERQIWNLLKATGSDHDVSGGLTPLLGPVWQASNLPWADPHTAALASLPPVGRAFHFGRLGFYKRSAQGLRQGHGRGQRVSSNASLNAGTVGASLGLMVLSTTALVNPALAGNLLPTGGVVTSGAGAISQTQNGAGLKITQSTQVLGLNWNSFSIGAGNSVVFEQPNAASVAINRVIGNSRSELFGSLQANGQVFLLNPNGVLIARTAQIDTGAFVAAAARDAQRDARGNWTLSGLSDAAVINQGSIRANGQGGFIVLAGAQATNEGVLSASSGVALAAGETVSLALDNNQMLSVKVDGAKLKALVQNKGLILADGGAVYLTAAGRDTLLGTVVNNEGLIQARGLSSKQGRIILSGTGGDVLNSGTLDVSGKAKGTKGGLVVLNGNRVATTGSSVIDASGDAAGGRVIIGGDQLGKASDVMTVTLADNTVIAPNAFINISSTSGDGGFVETSGHQLTMLGTVKGASAGKAGQWLIDPNDVTISTAADANMSGNPFTPLGSDNGVVNNGSIEAALNSGTDVTVTTAGSGSASGYITWSSGNISKTAGGNATLTLTANAGIGLSDINITSTSNRLNLKFSPSVSYGLSLNNTTLATNGGNITSSINTNGVSSFSFSGNNTMNTGAGSVSLSSTYYGSGFGSGFDLSGTWNVTTTSTVTVSIVRGSGNGFNLGGDLILNGGSLSISSQSNASNGFNYTGGNVTSNGGVLTLTGINYVSGAVYYLQSNLNLNATNNGSITLNSNAYYSGGSGTPFYGANISVTASNNSTITINPTAYAGATALTYDGAANHPQINANLTNNSKLNINAFVQSTANAIVFTALPNITMDATSAATFYGSSPNGNGIYYSNASTLNVTAGSLSLLAASTNGYGFNYLAGNFSASNANLTLSGSTGARTPGFRLGNDLGVTANNSANVTLIAINYNTGNNSDPFWGKNFTLNASNNSNIYVNGTTAGNSAALRNIWGQTPYFTVNLSNHSNLIMTGNNTKASGGGPGFLFWDPLGLTMDATSSVTVSGISTAYYGMYFNMQSPTTMNLTAGTMNLTGISGGNLGVYLQNISFNVSNASLTLNGQTGGISAGIDFAPTNITANNANVTLIAKNTNTGNTNTSGSDFYGFGLNITANASNVTFNGSIAGTANSLAYLTPNVNITLTNASNVYFIGQTTGSSSGVLLTAPLIANISANSLISIKGIGLGGLPPEK